MNFTRMHIRDKLLHKNIKDLGNNAVCERAEAYQSTARSRIFLVLTHTVCWCLFFLLGRFSSEHALHMILALTVFLEKADR